MLYEGLNPLLRASATSHSPPSLTHLTHGFSLSLLCINAISLPTLPLFTNFISSPSPLAPLYLLIPRCVQWRPTRQRPYGTPRHQQTVLGSGSVARLGLISRRIWQHWVGGYFKGEREEMVHGDGSSVRGDGAGRVCVVVRRRVNY